MLRRWLLDRLRLGKLSAVVPSLTTYITTLVPLGVSNKASSKVLSNYQVSTLVGDATRDPCLRYDKIDGNRSVPSFPWSDERMTGISQPFKDIKTTILRS